MFKNINKFTRENEIIIHQNLIIPTAHGSQIKSFSSICAANITRLHLENVVDFTTFFSTPFAFVLYFVFVGCPVAKIKHLLPTTRYKPPRTALFSSFELSRRVRIVSPYVSYIRAHSSNFLSEWMECLYKAKSVATAKQTIAPSHLSDKVSQSPVRIRQSLITAQCSAISYVAPNTYVICRYEKMQNLRMGVVFENAFIKVTQTHIFTLLA